MKLQWPFAKTQLASSEPAAKGNVKRPSLPDHYPVLTVSDECADLIAGSLARLAILQENSRVIMIGVASDLAERITASSGMVLVDEPIATDGRCDDTIDACLFVTGEQPDERSLAVMKDLKARFAESVIFVVAVIAGDNENAPIDPGILVGWIEGFTAVGMAATLHRSAESTVDIAFVIASARSAETRKPGEVSPTDRNEPLRLECFSLNKHELEMRPAPVRRDWMDATPDKYAYRCLPLNIANAHGWEILCPSGFTAIWNGGQGLADIIVEHDDKDDPTSAISHFGSGVLTFHVRGLFRTEPGFDLWVAGPVNEPRQHIYPLAGLVETDWLEFTFTMNWLMETPNFPVRFEKGEPFCSFFPVERGLIEKFDPVIRDIDEEPELKAAYKAYSDSRKSFNNDLKIVGSDARKEKWQRTYIRGADAKVASESAHRTKLNVRSFRRGT